MWDCTWVVWRSKPGVETPWNVVFELNSTMEHAGKSLLGQKIQENTLKRKRLTMANLPPLTAAAVAAETSEREEEDRPDVPVDNSMPPDRCLP